MHTALPTLVAVPMETPPRRVFYAIHFRGWALRSGLHSELLKTVGTSTVCIVTTLIQTEGIEATLQSLPGEVVCFESQLRVTGPGEYKETGRITFGDESRHSLWFSTVGFGHMTGCGEAGMTTGTASWKVEGGEGQFASAQGVVTSTFTVDDRGQRNDFHCGLIFLP